jgi:iron complex outermembrane receptor protein
MTNVSSRSKEQQQDVFSRNILAWNYAKNKSGLEIKTAWFYEDLIYGITTEGVLTDTLVDSQNKTNTFSAKAKYEYAFAKGIVLTTGIDVDHTYVFSNNYDGRQTRNTLSAYAAMVKDFADRFKVNLLLRADLVDAAVVPLMPLVGFNYKLLKNEEFFVRGSFSRNYHMPTLNDLYWFPGGNQDLIPEESLEIEGGLNYLKPFGESFYFGTDLSGYASRINNWIQWIPSDKGYWSPQNINEVFARGFELSANLSGTSGLFTFKLFAEYAFTKTTNESKTAQEAGNAGQQLVYIPEQTANGFLYGSVRGFYATFNLLYTGKRNTVMNEDGSAQGVLPAYWMSDLSFGKNLAFRKNKLDIRFKINNLFDVSYQAVRLRAMPGRNFELFIKYNLN